MRPELIVHKNPKSPNSEIFRTLRTNIQFMNTKKKLKTLLVTSTFPAEGKSWVASNLAVTFAQAGKKVVLIDADMRKGRQYRIFEISPKPGLSNYLSEAEIDENENSTVDVTSYIQETEVPNLYAISAGNVPPNPSELLVSAQMKKLLEDLKDFCDLVIIDGTPCELVTDSIILSRIVDCTVVVAAYKITKKDALERVIKNIQNVGGNLAGVVLNKIAKTKKYDQQYYYYGDHKSSSSKVKNNNISFNFLNKTINKKPKTEELENDIAKLYKEINEQDNDNNHEISELQNVNNSAEQISSVEENQKNDSINQLNNQNNSVSQENNETQNNDTNSFLEIEIEQNLSGQRNYHS